MKTGMIRKMLVLLGLMALYSACEQSYEPVYKGVVEFQITDAPSDDADIKSVFVTIADIKVDGQSINGFTRQTIDLRAYSEGNTKLLATSTLVTKAYSNLTLVLDAEMDANGSGPGCYVQTMDNSKFKLRSGTIEIPVTTQFSPSTNIKSAVIIDFDLRKTIKTETSPSVRYNFVNDANLKAGVRVMGRDHVSALNGIYTDQSGVVSDKVLVFAYKKGTYVSSEQAAQGDDQVTFSHAVTSAVVRGDQIRTFNLAFLEEGEYELHFASYKQTGSTQFTLQTMLAADLTINGTLANTVQMKSGVSMAVTTVITGGM